MHIKPDKFGIRELIPPPEDLPERLRAVFSNDPDDVYRLFPWQYIVTLNRLRSLFGPATMNTWAHFANHAEGMRFRGYRPMECSVGGTLSEHRFCRAGDMDFRDATPAEVWAHMVNNPGHPAYQYVERVEAYDGMTWLHWDMGQHARVGRAIRVFTVTDNRAGLPEYIAREQ